MIEIQLTQGYTTWIDDIDADLAELNWAATVKTSGVYAVKHLARNKTKQKLVYLHTIILSRIIGQEIEKGYEVDHIDLNPLNNLRNNLRLATHQENQRNQGLQSNSSSGATGVNLIARSGKWRAYIKINGRQIWLGSHDRFEDAVEARRKAEREYFGEFTPQI